MYKYVTEKLLASGIKELEIDNDYYWLIYSDDRENLERPPEPCIGSLIDDWEELKKNIQQNQLTTLDLDRLANVLIAIKENIEKTGKILLIK